MTTYEPGTVAIATVRGVKGVRVMRRESTLSVTHQDWAHSPDPERGLTYSCTNDDDVTDIRPLVVLDIEYVDSQWTDLVAYLRAGTWRVIADQIEAQTKRQAKPPRIPEPGLWGVVSTCLTDEAQRENNKGPLAGIYIHTSTGTWRHADTGYGVCWNELHDPTLIREGLS